MPCNWSRARISAWEWVNYQENLTQTSPEDGSASWLNAYFDRSRMRPSTYGPRSPTSHLIDLPVAVAVTVRIVPMGSVLWAQIHGLLAWYLASYQLARPSSEPSAVDPPVGIGRGDTVVGVLLVAAGLGL